MPTPRACCLQNPACSPERSAWVVINGEWVCPAHYQQRVLAENDFLFQSLELLVKKAEPRTARYARRLLNHAHANLGLRKAVS